MDTRITPHDTRMQGSPLAVQTARASRQVFSAGFYYYWFTRVVPLHAG